MPPEINNCVIHLNAECTDCGECDKCDLHPENMCSSCGKCLDLDSSDYSEIMIEGLLEDESEVEEYLLDNAELKAIHRLDSQLTAEKAGDYVFIEDIPELKEKYEKLIAERLNNKRS